MNKTAIIYARVSSAGQADEELPIASQIDVCERRAAELGADVVRVFTDEGITGRKLDREALQEAIDYCGVYDVDYFITWNTARFARNRAVAWMKYLLRKGGTSIVYVANPAIDDRTDDGWLLEGLFELMDENQSRTISKDTRRSMIKNARDGHFNGGTIPYGFTSAPAGKRRRLVVNEAEAEVVREIFGMCLEGAGVRSIALTLNRRDRLRRGGKPWNKNALLYLLRNKACAGYTTYNRHDADKNRERPRDEWIEMKSHDAIVSEEVFARAQELITSRGPDVDQGSPKSQFLFTGLLRCSRCNSRLQIEKATGRSRTYSYYNCRTALAGAGCAHRRLSADALDEWLLDTVMRRILTPTKIRELVEQIHVLRGRWVKERAVKRAGIAARLREAEGRRGKLLEVLELHGKDAPNLADLSDRLAVLTGMIRALDTELRQVDAAPAPAVQVGEEHIDQLADYFRLMVEGCEDAKRVRMFLSSFIDSVAVHPDHITVHYRPDRLIANGVDDGEIPPPVHSGGGGGPHFLATARGVA